MEEKKEHVGDWLEKLQRESWNLELLVSGFSIFLLVQAFEKLVSTFQYINLNTALEGNFDGMARTFVGILLMGSITLTINLVIHVFLRGFWIGAVGLRSVQDRIDLDKLNYSEFFTEKLKKQVPSLDRMLEKLDTLSSVIFSFTFLIIFMFFSFFLFSAFLSVFIYLVNIVLEVIEEESLLEQIVKTIAYVFAFSFVFAGLTYAFDTLSLGFLKKYKWISKIYYPIYKWIGVITMAGVYRSIYYSLISRFPKAYIRIALLAYVSLFVIFPFMKFDQYIYYPDNGSEFKLSSNDYDDLRNKDYYIYEASIPSRIVEGDFLPLFIRYNLRDNEVLEKFCQDFNPKKSNGINSGISIGRNGISLSDAFINEENPGNALKCFSEFYSVKIDSMQIVPDFYFYIHPNMRERGVQAMLEIENLSKGKHEIFVKRKKINSKDEIEDDDYVKIVFWKE